MAVLAEAGRVPGERCRQGRGKFNFNSKFACDPMIASKFFLVEFQVFCPRNENTVAKGIMEANFEVNIIKLPLQLRVQVFLTLLQLLPFS